MSVIARSAEIVGAIAGSGTSVRLTDLSAMTGLPLTTVHRLTTELVSAQLIERDATGAFTIGRGAWLLGRRYERAERFRAAAGRYLRDLHEVTRSTVELSQLFGGKLIVTERLTTEPGRWSGQPEELDLSSTAAGIAVLAASGTRFTTDVMAGLPGLRAGAVDLAMRDARSTGAARIPGATDAAVVVAAAIRTREGIAGAVSVTAAGDRAARAHVPSVLVTARRITAALAR